MSNTPPVVIAGAGIGGLTLAVALRRHGIACEILERAPRFAPIGAGISLSINAMASMRRLGLADELMKRAHVLRSAVVADEHGASLSVADIGAIEAQYGPSIALHRADLHEVLLAAVGDTPITLGAEVVQATVNLAAVSVKCANGVEKRAALLVGADGIHSRVRQLCFGKSEVVYSGYTCWRVVVDGNGDLRDAVEMWGRGKRFGIVNIGKGRAYCYATANAPAGTAPGTAAEFRARFAEFGGHAPALVQQVQRDDQLIHGDISDARSSKWHRPRVVLIGDAAHAMTPNLGQGAAMSVEDADVLADCLKEFGVENPAALDAWAARRMPRAQWVQRQSWRIGAIAQWSNPLARALRTAILRAAPASAATNAIKKLAAAPA